MAVEILMPELGESVHEGTVSRWLKKVGEFVKEDEPVVEIMTDKVNTELPAPASGVLKEILIPEGSQVMVFHAMGIIDDGGEAPVATDVPTDAKAAEEPAEAGPAPTEPEPTREVQSNGERRWFSPVVRSIAKANNVSDETLAGIAGSGEGGRVTKKDIEAFLGGGAAPSAKPKSVLEEKPAAPTVAGKDQELVPLTGMRKMIADAMVRSSQVPTVTTLTEVDVTSMVKFRESNKESFQQQFGVKLTFTPFFMKAIAESLVQFPLVNAALMPDNNIVMNKQVHMGVAVALGAKGDEGLIVPVIREANSKSLVELAKELETVAKKARSNSLTVADVQGGTFTLTNPGSYGAVLGTPMINAPQAAIIGTYTFKKMPVIVDEMIAIRSIMNLVLTYDHRIIDGGLAGRFLLSVKERLEKFDFFK